jgi:hypothetical protein
MPSGTGSGLPSPWRDAIVGAVTKVVGEAPIFLIGSRATGEASSHSDCDVSVVLPSRKVPGAARRLPAVSVALSRDFGVPVSVNPVPKLLFRRARHNLYVLKIRLEGVALCGHAYAAPGRIGDCQPGQALAGTGWNPDSPMARRAQVSYLMSAVHTLLGGVDSQVIQGGADNARAAAALRKAWAQAAQACLLSTGRYVTGAQAVPMAEQLGLLPARSPGAQGFAVLRAALLRLLGPAPVGRSGVHSAARDLQYVALSALRGHWRWQVLCRYRGIEARLASASLYLLQSLAPGHLDGYDDGLLGEAVSLLPPALRPRSQDYHSIRDTILREWASAQPLVGVIP